MLGAHVPEMLALTRRVWSSTRSADERLEAMGCLSSEIVATAREEAIESVILPGLERLLKAMAARA
jgi:hypothetical protein